MSIFNANAFHIYDDDDGPDEIDCRENCSNTSKIRQTKCSYCDPKGIFRAGSWWLWLSWKHTHTQHVYVFVYVYYIVRVHQALFPPFLRTQQKSKTTENKERKISCSHQHECRCSVRLLQLFVCMCCEWSFIIRMQICILSAYAFALAVYNFLFSVSSSLLNVFGKMVMPIHVIFVYAPNIPKYLYIYNLYIYRLHHFPQNIRTIIENENTDRNGIDIPEL